MVKTEGETILTWSVETFCEFLCWVPVTMAWCILGLQMEDSFEYIEWTVTDIWQGVVFQLGGRARS